MDLTRRSVLGGIVAALAAPAIIRTPGLLMPVKPVVPMEFSTHDVRVRATERLVPAYWDNRLSAASAPLNEESLAYLIEYLKHEQDRFGRRLRLKPTKFMGYVSYGQ